MGKLFAICITAAAALTAGCSTWEGMGRGEQVGTVGGAVAGGAVGSAVTGGSTLGTLGGAAIGGAAGNVAGDRYDERQRR